MEGTALRPIAGAHPHLSRAASLAWASVALFAVLATVSLFLEVRFVGRATLLDIWAVIALAASGVVGALIVSAHPRHPIGWMFCAAAVSFGVSFFSMQYAILALVVQPGTLPFGQAMAWFGFWAEMPGIAVVALFLPLLFPDGHLPSPRWRPVAYFAGATVVFAVLFTMVAPDTYASVGYASIRNPIGLDQYKAFFDAVGNAMQPLLFGLVVVSAVALFDRERRAVPAHVRRDDGPGLGHRDCDDAVRARDRVHACQEHAAGDGRSANQAHPESRRPCRGARERDRRPPDARRAARPRCPDR